MRRYLRPNPLFAPCVVLLWLGLLGPIASAEVPEEVWTSLSSTSVELRLKDGTVVKGRILTSSDTTVTLILPGGEVVTSEKRDVESIKRNSGVDRFRIATQEAGERVRIGTAETREGWGAMGSSRTKRDPSDQEYEDLDSPTVSLTSIASAELSNSAETLPKSSVVVHALKGPLSVGVHDSVQLQTHLLELISGPNIGARVKLFSSDTMTLAFEPRAWWGWRYASHSYSGMFRLSAASQKHWVHFGAGLAHHRLYARIDTDEDVVTWSHIPRVLGTGELQASFDEEDSDVRIQGVQIPVSVEWDRVIPTGGLVIFGLQSSVRSLATGYGYRARINLEVAQTFGVRGRISGGLFFLLPGYLPSFYDDDLDDSISESIEGADIPEWPIAPIPTIDIWWRF